jgi:peptidoglycan/xylan/chitin deacetylase (PgdA/CDA1 family)
MKYPFSAITQRGPLQWPDDAKVALIVTINLEHWDMVKDTDAHYYAGGPPILPSTLPGNVADFPNYSWREYGQRVGIWRLFELFDEIGVPASCPINAKTALERPAIVDAIKERGWEILAHNYEQAELLTDFAHDADREREVVLRTLEVYEQIIGKPAKGWLSSSLRGTVNTCGLLAEQGLIFYCDIMNDDQPYLISTDHGDIVSVPYNIEINDYTMLSRMSFSTDQFLDAMKEELSVILSEAEASGSGRMMNVGLHPHVSGRAYRVRAIRDFLSYAKSLDGVWFATREEIAEWYLQNNAGHIV